MTAIILRRGDLNKYLAIERPVPDDSFNGAGSGSWEHVDDVWAGVQDMLPSRGVRLTDGFSPSTRPARVRMDYREDVVAGMRLVLGSRIMLIVSEPAELGLRGGIEFMVEDYRPAGNAT